VCPTVFWKANFAPRQMFFFILGSILIKTRIYLVLKLKYSLKPLLLSYFLTYIF